ncbi:hypothetical protein GCM10010264_29900 [Streptomyces globisporus]|nr:hypothetical protein GCM10010264_29900 [Streptomyces globisporus]
MSRRENPLEFERRNGPTAVKTSPADWESGPKGSDRVGLAGKGNAKAKNLESKTARPASTGNRTRKSLIESETQDSKTKKKNEGKRPEGPGDTGPKEASVP